MKVTNEMTIMLEVWAEGRNYKLYAMKYPHFLFLKNGDDEGMELTRENLFEILDKHFKEKF